MSPEEREEQGKVSRQWAIDNFSVEVIGKKFEEFIDSTDATGYDFSDLKSESQKKNFPDAIVPNIENDSEWILALYKHILNLDNHVNDDGYKNWMNALSNKVPRSQVEQYFRKVAKDHNDKHFPVQINDFLDDDDGKRIIYVIPESSVDVLLSTSLFKSIKEKYPKYNLYVATKPQYFHILDGNEYIHKVIPYDNKFDNALYLEGAGSQKGFFEIAFLPYLTTQRANNYIHNAKDLIDKDYLCTF